MPAPLKRRALELLREHNRREKDFIRQYVPLKSTAPFHRTKKPIAILFGGNRSGKTHSNMAQLAMIARDMHPYFKDKDIKILWAATESFDMVGKVLWEEKLSRMIPPHEIERIVWYNKSRNCPLELHLMNGRRIEFKAYEQGREKFQARSVPYIALDEQLDEDIWNEIRMRTLDSGGYIRLSATPVRYQQWLQELADNPPISTWIGYANLNENRVSRGGYVPDEAIDTLIEEWPENVKITRIEGRFASFLGAVFTEWEPSLSVIPPRDLPLHWDYYIGVDFGYSNPFCALLLAHDPDGRWYAIREHYKSHTLLEEHAQVIESWRAKYPIRAIIGDHAAQERAQLRSMNINVLPAKKEVKNAIDTMHSLMRPVASDGKPRFLVMRAKEGDPRGCPNLLRQIPNYRWAEPTEKANAKEDVLKLDDHAIDAAKMAIYTIEKGHATSARGASIF